MPELPDVAVYVEHLESRLVGQALERVRLLNPFVLRSVTPPVAAAEGRKVTGVRRVGKRIVIALEGGLFLVLHLMIAGRLRWMEKMAKLPGRITLAAFEFSNGMLVFTEAGTKRRASLHLVEGEAALAAMDPGGLEVLDASAEEFARRLRRDNHTLKRALTDPRLFSGIGNAYSDEILHRARLSPLAMTRSLSAEAVQRLHEAARAVLVEWTDRLRAEAGGGDERRERGGEGHAPYSHRSASIGFARMDRFEHTRSGGSGGRGRPGCARRAVSPHAERGRHRMQRADVGEVSPFPDDEPERAAGPRNTRRHLAAIRGEYGGGGNRTRVRGRTD